MRYFVRLAYNGTAFHGSQTQPNGTTVQQTLEQAFATILRQPVALTFAGRTDAGVHALEMFAHFDLDSPLNSKLLTSKLNSLLPLAITVYNIFPVADDLHARFSALARTYYYKVTDHKDPFNLHLYTQVAPGLDFQQMNLAAQYLLGEHDFASFCKLHTDVKTTLCTVTEAYWQDNVFTITANRFLRNMVRAVVGTLFEVGRHKMSVADFQSVMAAQNRCAAGQSVSPDGLYLAHIIYPKDAIQYSPTK